MWQNGVQTKALVLILPKEPPKRLSIALREADLGMLELAIVALLPVNHENLKSHGMREE